MTEEMYVCVPHKVVLCLWLLPVWLFVLPLQMEKLHALGINPDVPRHKVSLSSLGNQLTLLTLTDMLFCKAAEKTLTTPVDKLVGQRISRGGKPLNEKLADNIWTVIHYHASLISEKREV